MKEYISEGLKETLKSLQQYQPQLPQFEIPQPKKKKGLTAGAITAIALGGSALVLTGAALGFWFARRRYIAEHLCCDITTHDENECCCDESEEFCTCEQQEEKKTEETCTCKCCEEKSVENTCEYVEEACDCSENV